MKSGFLKLFGVLMLFTLVLSACNKQEKGVLSLDSLIDNNVESPVKDSTLMSFVAAVLPSTNMEHARIQFIPSGSELYWVLWTEEEKEHARMFVLTKNGEELKVLSGILFVDKPALKLQKLVLQDISGDDKEELIAEGEYEKEEGGMKSSLMVFSSPFDREIDLALEVPIMETKAEGNREEMITFAEVNLSKQESGFVIQADGLIDEKKDQHQQYSWSAEKGEFILQ